jgi:hypothetical protein
MIIAPCGLEYVKDYGNLKKPYKALTFYKYHSDRYGKDALISIGDRSDGATGAFDIPSLGWWIHDNLCEKGCWEDGTKLTNWQCSTVLYDILKSEGRFVRARRWRYATFAFGGDKCRDNGMFTLKKDKVL